MKSTLLVAFRILCENVCHFFDRSVENMRGPRFEI